ncbi:MAG: AMP-binding protein [Actinomycetia bacterium]|nr:AMP-binding protein [Actinomycetes bacterium]
MARLFDDFELDRWLVDPPDLPGGLYGLLQQVNARYAAKPALQTSDGRSLTFAELASEIEQCRKSLAVWGVEPGDRILVYVEKSPATVLLFLACLSHGAVYVPINPAYTPVELQELVRDCTPRLVVCDPSREPQVGEWVGGPAAAVQMASMGSAGRLARPAEPRIRHSELRPSGNDPAVILYTSGTTGKPRGAVLSHRAVAANVLALCRVWDMRSSDILVHALPLFHTHGLLVALMCALLAGASTFLMPSFDPEEAIRLFGQATVFMAVPTYYTRLMDSPALRREALAGMRLFTSGSAPLLPQVWEEFRRRSGRRIVERYGMTEVGIVTSNPLNGERLPGSVGYALEGVELKVVDNTGDICGPGATGELWVRSAGAFNGYLNSATETAGTRDPLGWVATGDLAVLDGDGRVRLKGRSKDLIITGGLNVHPMGVEEVLNSVPGVVESAVFGVPHPDFGEAVVAAVVWDGEGEEAAEPIRQALASRLAGYRIPKLFLETESLPRNAMGKVQKTVLRSRHAELFS